MRVGDVLFSRRNRNVLLVLRVKGWRVETLYLDNVDPAFVGTLFEHELDYLERAYAPAAL